MKPVVQDIRQIPTLTSSHSPQKDVPLIKMKIHFLSRLQSYGTPKIPGGLRSDQPDNKNKKTKW